MKDIKEKSAECEYCKNGKGICIDNKRELGIELHSAKSKLVAYGLDKNNWDISVECNINYCPMCRKEFKKMIEEWKNIKGLLNYQISNLGRIRSLDKECIRKNGRKLFTKGKILKSVKDTKGYLRTQLSTKTIKIHREVAKAFISNPNNLKEVNHIDGNKQNNRVDNLEWVNHEDNIKHAIENGLYKSRTKLHRDNKGRFRKLV